MTYTQRHGQIQSWTPGAVRTKKRKGKLSQQPQEQQIKAPQSTWCTLHHWNTWIDNKSSQNWGSGLWEQRYIYFFSFFSFCECVCVCFFVWFCLYSFAFTICPRVLSHLITPLDSFQNAFICYRDIYWRKREKSDTSDQMQFGISTRPNVHPWGRLSFSLSVCSIPTWCWAAEGKWHNVRHSLGIKETS